MDFVETKLFCFLTIQVFYWINSDASCAPGWFGSKCQFMCHCTEECDVVTGQCLNHSRCAVGWFGLACQHFDITTDSASILTNSELETHNWITDRNDNTCNADINLHFVTVLWNQSFPFTWLRLTLTDIKYLENVTVKFKTNITELSDMECEKQDIFFIDGQTADIVCHVVADVIQLNITGQGVKSLCSLYINGGRNVALKQNAVQSTTYLKNGLGASQASNAVDGNTNGSFASNTCTHTDAGDTSPSWTVTFDHPMLINRVLVYNRIGHECGGPSALSCHERLQKFKLVSFNSQNSAVFSYQDTRDSALLKFTVMVPGSIRELPVSRLQINATVTVNNDSSPVLTLCEFEAFGDCVSGTWGLECNNTCNSSCKKACHAETGACQVCLGSSNSPNCDITCPKGFHGSTCSESCSVNCKNGECNPLTGVCLQCKPGYLGPLCTQACGHRTYGQVCSLNCSLNCKVNESLVPEVCHHVTGTCLLGCTSDYSGIFCLSDPLREESPTGSTDRTTELGIAFGVTVGCLLAVILVIMIYVWRRIGRNPSLNSLQQSDYDHSINYVNNIEDEHEYERVKTTEQQENKSRRVDAKEINTTPAAHRQENNFKIESVNCYDNIDFK